MFHTKLQSNIPNDSGEEANFVVLALLVMAKLDSRLTQFYNSETVQSGAFDVCLWAGLFTTGQRCIIFC